MYQIPNTIYTKYQMPNIRYQIPDTKHQIPCNKYQIPNTRYKIPTTIYQIPNNKIKSAKDATNTIHMVHKFYMLL